MAIKGFRSGAIDDGGNDGIEVDAWLEKSVMSTMVPMRVIATYFLDL